MITWTIIVLLLVLWALGLVASYSLGGVIHVLPIAAFGMAFFRLVGRRRHA